MGRSWVFDVITIALLCICLGSVRSGWWHYNADELPGFTTLSFGTLGACSTVNVDPIIGEVETCEWYKDSSYQLFPLWHSPKDVNETQLFNSTIDDFFNSTFINTTLLIDTRCCNRNLRGIGVLAVLLYAICLAGAVTAGILGVISYWEVAPKPLRTTAGIIHILGVPLTLIAAACMLGWFLGDASKADVPRPRIKYAQIIAFVVPFTHMISGAAYTFFQL